MSKAIIASPKRRGRPAKAVSSESTVVVTPAKRRGRPFKVKSPAPENVIEVIAKRRGRPFKNAATPAKEKNVIAKSVTTGSYEGLQMLVASMPTPAIEVWDFQYPGSNTELSIEIPEFTCVCPKTGLPDFATIMIDYCPGKYCIELKSLKEYIVFYRNLGIFHEHVVNRMLKDIAKACKPLSMTITGVFNARGGIQTTVQAKL
jgi:7-cyano-7-deazaguanine reductase